FCMFFIVAQESICLGQSNPKITKESFLQQAELFMLNGVSLSKYAQVKVKNSQLKQYAISAHNDYVKVNRQLLALAAQGKIELPNLQADSAAILEIPFDEKIVSTPVEGPLRLKNIFDASLLKMMIEDFQTAIDYYELSLNDVDVDLKQHVTICLPIFKKNLMEAINFTQPVLAKD
ncbi:MAG: DUF4142 domain-containing protein, partial [Pedobacter sp.]